MLKGYPLLQQIVLSYRNKVYFQEAPLTQFGMNYVSVSLARGILPSLL